MYERQQLLLAKFEANKPELLKEIDEILYFVKVKTGKVIENGCKEDEVDALHQEMNALQRKFRGKGYYVH